MEADYWHDKWATGDIKFHQADYNPLMMKHFPTLGLVAGARVFVPLCGKTRDIAWLLEQGFAVVGAELNDTAVQELFAELGAVPKVTQVGALTRYAAPGLDVFVGDIFDLSADDLGHVDAVFDRAALVALPAEMRARYADHVMAITGRVPQFLLTFTYDQSTMDGPPFSITDKMVADYFAATYAVKTLEVFEIPPPGLKGQVPAIETAWLLT